MKIKEELPITDKVKKKRKYTEASFVKAFTKKFLAKAHCVRIESNTIRGIPDMNICVSPNFHFWIEFKCHTTKLRPEQRLFIRKRIKVGGLVMVVAYYSETILIFNNPISFTNTGIIEDLPLARMKMNDDPIRFTKLCSIYQKEYGRRDDDFVEEYKVVYP